MIKPITNTKNAINQDKISEYHKQILMFFGAKIKPTNAINGGNATKQICIRTYASYMRLFKTITLLITEMNIATNNRMSNDDKLGDVSISNPPSLDMKTLVIKLAFLKYSCKTY